MNTPTATRLHPLLAASAALLLLAAPRLAATNGMNMEGYGPIATAMGGASLAFDNGTAAVINNPATLTLMPDRARLDVAVGVLGPQITATAPGGGASAESESTSFFMPALGYVQRQGDFVYGLGIFGQGGMGCQYSPDSWRGLGFGLQNRTEVSIGRVIAPLAWRINDQLSVAATADFVWAGMDLQMAMSGAQFMDLVSTHRIGEASGSIVQSFGAVMAQMPAGTSVDYAYFDFSNNNNFTGKASATGYAGKVGVLYTPAPTLRFGLTYHSKTRLSNLHAPANSMSFQLDIPGMGAMAQTLAGDITVRDFECPAMLGAGFAWEPAPRWLIAGDIRQVYWADVMQNFNLRFVASSASTNGPFAGQVLDAKLYQDWSDQTVYELGAAWQATDTFTLRFGANYGKDPIPDRTLMCLFPATVETHLSIGGSWTLTPRDSLHASYVHGFAKTVTAGSGVKVEHAQNNVQLLYSRTF